MRINFLIAWCGVLAWGAWYLENRKAVMPAVAAPAEAAWTTARALPVNWRLADDDIVESAAAPAGKPWVGKYLKTAMEAKKEIKPGDLDIEPHVPQSGTLSVYLLPLAAGAENRLNAGQKIDVMEGRVAVASNVDVAAVRCAPGCEAILQVSPEARERLKGLTAATPEWVLR